MPAISVGTDESISVSYAAPGYGEMPYVRLFVYLVLETIYGE